MWFNSINNFGIPLEMPFHEDEVPVDDSVRCHAPPATPTSFLAFFQATPALWFSPRTPGGTAAQPPLGETHDTQQTKHRN